MGHHRGGAQHARSAAGLRTHGTRARLRARIHPSGGRLRSCRRRRRAAHTLLPGGPARPTRVGRRRTLQRRTQHLDAGGDGRGPRARSDRAGTGRQQCSTVCPRELADLSRTPELPDRTELITMSRPITLFTGQWADLPFEEVARLAGEWGYDGLEIACWGGIIWIRGARPRMMSTSRTGWTSSPGTGSRSTRSPTTSRGRRSAMTPSTPVTVTFSRTASGATGTRKGCVSARPRR